MRYSEGRTVGLYTKVSPEEKKVINQKMALLGTTNLRAYLRKMAVDGYVVQLDMGSVVELVKLLRSISNNVNQIARRCNETRNAIALTNRSHIKLLVKKRVARLCLLLLLLICINPPLSIKLWTTQPAFSQQS